jgi:hypothetical protein
MMALIEKVKCGVFLSKVNMGYIVLCYLLVTETN